MLTLTPEERKVIIFLCAVAFAGIGINFTMKSYPPSRKVLLIHSDAGKININTADTETLMSIPGVGKRLAERIVAYRNGQAGFSAVDQLTNVKGITDEKLARIKEYVTVK